LLGKAPEINENDATDLPKVLSDLGIVDTEFKIDELQRAKRSIKEGKSAGPDNLAPVLKRCDFDETILYFANKLVTDHETKAIVSTGCIAYSEIW